MPSFDPDYVNGVKVAERTPAKAVPLYATIPGGRSSGPKPFKSISEILLEDGQVLNQCDDCGYTAERITSIVAHRSRRHPKPHKATGLTVKGKSPTPRVTNVIYAEKPALVDQVTELVKKSSRQLGNKEIADTLGLNYHVASDALKRAVMTGRIRRVQRGFYAPVEKASEQPPAQPNKLSQELNYAGEVLVGVGEMLQRVARTVPALSDDYEVIQKKAKLYDEIQEFMDRK